MSTTAIHITGKTMLITGANRGLGKALVEEALKRGARRVYAASRRLLVHADERTGEMTRQRTSNGIGA